MSPALRSGSPIRLWLEISSGHRSGYDPTQAYTADPDQVELVRSTIPLKLNLQSDRGVNVYGSQSFPLTSSCLAHAPRLVRFRFPRPIQFCTPRRSTSSVGLFAQQAYVNSFAIATPVLVNPLVPPCRHQLLLPPCLLGLQ